MTTTEKFEIIDPDWKFAWPEHMDVRSCPICGALVGDWRKAGRGPESGFTSARPNRDFHAAWHRANG